MKLSIFTQGVVQMEYYFPWAKMVNVDKSKILEQMYVSKYMLVEMTKAGKVQWWNESFFWTSMIVISFLYLTLTNNIISCEPKEAPKKRNSSFCLLVQGVRCRGEGEGWYKPLSVLSFFLFWAHHGACGIFFFFCLSFTVNSFIEMWFIYNSPIFSIQILNF